MTTGPVPKAAWLLTETLPPIAVPSPTVRVPKLLAVPLLTRVRVPGPRIVMPPVPVMPAKPAPLPPKMTGERMVRIGALLA